MLSFSLQTRPKLPKEKGVALGLARRRQQPHELLSKAVPPALVRAVVGWQGVGVGLCKVLCFAEEQEWKSREQPVTWPPAAPPASPPAPNHGTGLAGTSSCKEQLLNGLRLESGAKHLGAEGSQPRTRDSEMVYF